MRRQRGSVFIISLVVMAVLILLVVSAASALRTDLLAQTNEVNAQRAERMAESGVQMAAAALIDVDPNVLSDQDEWFTFGQNGAEEFVLGDGTFRIEVLDAGSFININTISEEFLENLPLTTEQIDSLLDWREEQMQPRVEGGKDEFYNQLTYPYNARLGLFESVEEVLLVKGFEPAVLYDPPQEVSGFQLQAGNIEDLPPLFEMLTVDSTSPNVNAATGEAKININEASTNQLIQAGLSPQVAASIVQQRNSQGTFETLGAALETQGLSNTDAQAILDSFTVSTAETLTGRINLNTAPEYVLNAVPGITTDVTQAIIGRQGSFASLGELATLPGVSVSALAEIADVFTVGSNSFIVRVMGQYGGRRQFWVAVVTIQDGQPRVTKMRRAAFSDMLVRWNWADEAETQTVVVEGI